MNKFDELMIMNSKLDAVLDDMKKANYHLENELKAKRDAAQKQMFDDVDVLRGYMIKVGMRNEQLRLNTGINFKRNLVFVFDVCTHTKDIGLGVMNANNHKDFCFYRWFDSDKSIAETNIGFNEFLKNYMFTIMKHWDVAYANLQNDLFDKLQEFMAEKASEVTNKQSDLVAALDAFDRKE